jgi:hypothetical protein
VADVLELDPLFLTGPHLFFGAMRSRAWMPVISSIHTVCVKLSQQFRSLQITITHRVDLLVEDFPIRFFRIRPVTGFVQLQLCLGQQCAQMSGGDRFDNSAFNTLINDLRCVQRATGRPDSSTASQATAKIIVSCSAVKSHGRPLRCLFREDTLDDTSEVGGLFEPFHQREPFKLLLPAPPPASDGIVPQPHDVIDLEIESPFKCEALSVHVAGAETQS